MTVEELYYRLGSLVRNGYGTCKINMNIPDDTAFEENWYVSYNIDDIKEVGTEINLISKKWKIMIILEEA